MLACPDEGIRPCGEIGANKGAGRLGKIRAVLACPNEGQRPCGEQGANKGAGRLGKSGPCWRVLTKDKGLAGNKAPTRAPAGRKKTDRVGVPRRRNKALRGGRRQQGRRQAWKIRTVLACPNEGIRSCGEQGANKGVGKPGKSGQCWRAPTKE